MFGSLSHLFEKAEKAYINNLYIFNDFVQITNICIHFNSNLNMPILWRNILNLICNVTILHINNLLFNICRT